MMRGGRGYVCIIVLLLYYIDGWCMCYVYHYFFAPQYNIHTILGITTLPLLYYYNTTMILYYSLLFTMIWWWGALRHLKFVTALTQSMHIAYILWSPADTRSSSSYYYYYMIIFGLWLIAYAIVACCWLACMDRRCIISRCGSSSKASHNWKFHCF